MPEIYNRMFLVNIQDELDPSSKAYYGEIVLSLHSLQFHLGVYPFPSLFQYTWCRPAHLILCIFHQAPQLI